MAGRRVKTGGNLREYARLKAAKGVLLPMIKEGMLASFGADDDRRTDILHPSDMSHSDWCPRADYYRIHDGVEAPERFNWVRENIFDEGNEIHVKWQRRLRDTGQLWGSWRCMVCRERRNGCLEPEEGWYDAHVSHKHYWEYKEVPLEDGMVAGHADGAMTTEHCLVEIKSLGVGTLRFEAPKLLGRYTVETTDGRKITDLDRLWKNFRRPFTSHVKQANWYLWLAKVNKLPFDRMVFIYESKWNQQVREFTIELSDSIIGPQLDRASQVVVALANGVPPPCIGDQCKQCPAIREIIGEDSTPQHRRVKTRAGQLGSVSGAAAAGPEPAPLGPEAGGGPAEPPPRRYVRHRPGADADPYGADCLEEVSGHPARLCHGRRGVRQRAG